MSLYLFPCLPRNDRRQAALNHLLNRRMTAKKGTAEGTVFERTRRKAFAFVCTGGTSARICCLRRLPRRRAAIYISRNARLHLSAVAAFCLRLLCSAYCCVLPAHWRAVSPSRIRAAPPRCLAHAHAYPASSWPGAFSPRLNREGGAQNIEAKTMWWRNHGDGDENSRQQSFACAAAYGAMPTALCKHRAARAYATAWRVSSGGAGGVGHRYLNEHGWIWTINGGLQQTSAIILPASPVVVRREPSRLRHRAQAVVHPQGPLFLRHKTSLGGDGVAVASNGLSSLISSNSMAAKSRVSETTTRIISKHSLRHRLFYFIATIFGALKM
jgi:hypothetical protein